MFIPILLISTLISLAHSQLSPVSDATNIYKLYDDMLLSLRDVKNFETIIMLKAPLEHDCLPLNYVISTGVPILMLNRENRVHLKLNYNKEMLVLVCFQQNYDEELLQTLAANFNEMRHVRTIFMARAIADPQKLLQQLVQFCSAEQMINSLVVFDDFHINGGFYRYKAFPIAAMEQGVYAPQMILFPRKQFNMLGKTLITLPDQNDPRSFMYLDKSGRQRLSGYVAQLFLLFLQKYNGTYKFLYPVAVGETIHMSHLDILTLEGKLDIAISLSSPVTLDGFQRLSYPVELAKWLIMVPCAKVMPTQDIYGLILSKGAKLTIIGLIVVFQLLHAIIRYMIYHHCWQRRGYRFNFIDLLVDERVYPAVFGLPTTAQSASIFSLKILFLAMFLFGLVWSTLFAAHLKTLLTTHPNYPEIRNLADMRRAPLKLLMDSKEIPMLKTRGPPSFANNMDLIKPTNTLSFHHRRLTMHGVYAYPVPTSLWSMLEQQQKYFRRKVFCTPPTLKIMDMLILGIPVPYNSIYKNPLDRLIHQIHEAGLMTHWETITFNDMFQNGRISLKDIGVYEGFNDMNVKDLRDVWRAYFIGIGISLVVFVMELFVSAVKQYFRNIVKCIKRFLN